MDATGELKADYTWKVELNMAALGDGKAAETQSSNPPPA